MLYEVRTYTYTVGTASQEMDNFEPMIEKREKLAPNTFLAYFYCIAGQIHRSLNIWRYENSAHREEARVASLGQSWWPPLNTDNIQRQVTRLMSANPFCPKPEPGIYGEVYEIRSAFMLTGRLRQLNATWEKHLPERTAISPLVAAFSNEAGQFESGVLNEFITFWPYRDLNHWNDVREAAQKLPNWPSASLECIKEETAEIWRPAHFSPIH